jgi:hypothetical protein
VDTLGFRFATQESPGFETGCSTCGNFAHKLFLVGIGRSIGFPNTASGRFGLYLQGPASAHTMGAEMNDRNPDNLGYAGHDEIVRYAMGPASGWTGTWNTWLVRIAFTDASTAPPLPLPQRTADRHDPDESVSHLAQRPCLGRH